MSYKIPMGPYHPGLEEPYKLDMICEGETVKDAEAAYRLQLPRHRAPGRNAQLRSGHRAHGARLRHLLLHSHAHALPGHGEAGRRRSSAAARQYIRVIMAELERLHSHVLWAGIAAKLMGFKTMFMTCFALREKVMDVLQAISGNRVNYSMNRIGGVNRDIEDPIALVPMIDELEREMMRTVIPIFTTSSTARSRCAGIGVLTHEKAISCAVVGPTARASGIAAGPAPRRALRRLRGDGVRSPGGAGRRRARPPLRPRARNHGELQHPPPGAHQDAARRNLRRRRQARLRHRHGHQPR